jgi:hypothetical protein
MENDLWIACYAVLAYLAICTMPAVCRFAKHIRQAEPIMHQHLYKDKDGMATEESMASYSTKTPFKFIFIGVALGLIASLAHMVNHILEVHEAGMILLLFCGWVRNGLL